MPAPYPTARRRADWNRALSLLGAGLFGVSLAFPVVASAFPRAQRATWIGALDVTLAVALLAAAMTIISAARGRIGVAVRETCYQLYRVLATLPLILFVVFLLLGDRLAWDVLLPGLGWRAWLLVYVLPAWLALWTRGAETCEQRCAGGEARTASWPRD
jgi:hypothetical protein